MEIQVPQYCKFYTKNENMNKTCKGKTRCVIYYEQECKEYKDETCNNNSISDYNGSNSDFYNVFE